MVGDIELRGLLPPSTRLAIGAPSCSGAKVKSVSSLLRKKPLTVRPEPNGPSIVEVKEATLPSRSTATMFDVAGTSPSAAAVTRGAPGGLPAVACAIERSGEIRRERSAR